MITVIDIGSRAQAPTADGHIRNVLGAAETGTRLMSLRLSHTMNDFGACGPVAIVCTGIEHSRSQPGQIALAAGRAFASNPCVFRAATALTQVTKKGAFGGVDIASATLQPGLTVGVGKASVP